ncbi:MAG: hypothetical protein IPJ03_20330 [Ignavibacteriales bacterium]|nr:hypothetical protein [Ignavibacteriales bacterium]
MELIPILSTIILVATISTFILAIGAYILFKVRERRGEKYFVQNPANVQGELVTPEDNLSPRDVFKENKSSQYPKRKTLYVEDFTTNQKKEAKPVTPTEPREYVTQKLHNTLKKEASTIENVTSELKPDENKFLKYTREGYIPTSKDKSGEELKWR